MRKLLAIAAAAMSLIGCSNDNQIVIRNDAFEPISFNFRAAEYVIKADTTITIGDIPNGTYEANIGIWVPGDATSYSVSPAGATFTFQKESTKYLASFGSAYVAGVYAVTWNWTSTDSKGSVTGP